MVFLEQEVFRRKHKTPQREEVNWAPQSEAILKLQDRGFEYNP